MIFFPEVKEKWFSKENEFIVFDYLDPLTEDYRGNSVMCCMLMRIPIIIYILIMTSNDGSFNFTDFAKFLDLNAQCYSQI